VWRNGWWRPGKADEPEWNVEIDFIAANSPEDFIKARQDFFESDPTDQCEIKVFRESIVLEPTAP